VHTSGHNNITGIKIYQGHLHSLHWTYILLNLNEEHCVTAQLQCFPIVTSPRCWFDQLPITILTSVAPFPVLDNFYSFTQSMHRAIACPTDDNSWMTSVLLEAHSHADRLCPSGGPDPTMPSRAVHRCPASINQWFNQFTCTVFSTHHGSQHTMTGSAIAAL